MRKFYQLSKQQIRIQAVQLVRVDFALEASLILDGVLKLKAIKFAYIISWLKK